MRIPKDTTGTELIKLLKPYGYEVMRKSGSHMRGTTELNGEHSETMPKHSPLKIGTLNNILKYS